MRQLLTVIILSWFVFNSCKINTEIPGCNPEEGRFVNGKHYISGNMLTEDKHWDYISIEKYHQRRAHLYPDSSCIPIEDEPSFEETLQDKEEALDLAGHH